MPPHALASLSHSEIEDLAELLAEETNRVARAGKFEFDPAVLESVETRKIILCGFDPVISGGQLYEVLRNGFEIVQVADDERAGDRVFRHQALSSFELATAPLPRASILLNCSTHNHRAYQAFQKAADYIKRPIINIQQLACISRHMGMPIELTIDPAYYVQSIIENGDRLLSILPWLDDVHSRRVLLQIMLGRLTIDFDWFWDAYSPVEDMYFPEFFKYREDEIFIDAGAFDGSDTVRFIRRNRGHFKAAHLFEISAPNLRKIAQTLEQYDGTNVKERLYIVPAGLWEKKGQLAFTGEGVSTLLADVHTSKKPALHAGTCQVADLDSVVEAATLIKFEIEGAEMPALRGARGVIKKCRPNMAISAYHLSNDIVDIIRFLGDLDLGYKFRLRHHWGTDIRTVIYAATEFR